MQRLPGQHPDLDREQRAEVQWMLDALEGVADVPAAIGRLVKETMALGQVPVKKPARQALAAAEAQKLIRTFGLLSGCKESELKARLGEVRKLSFVRSMSLIDI